MMYIIYNDSIDHIGMVFVMLCYAMWYPGSLNRFMRQGIYKTTTGTGEQMIPRFLEVFRSSEMPTREELGGLIERAEGIIAQLNRQTKMLLKEFTNCREAADVLLLQMGGRGGDGGLLLQAAVFLYNNCSQECRLTNIATEEIITNDIAQSVPLDDIRMGLLDVFQSEVQSPPPSTSPPRPLVGSIRWEGRLVGSLSVRDLSVLPMSLLLQQVGEKVQISTPSWVSTSLKIQDGQVAISSSLSLLVAASLSMDIGRESYSLGDFLDRWDPLLVGGSLLVTRSKVDAFTTDFRLYCTIN